MAPTGGPPNGGQAVIEAPAAEITIGQPLQDKQSSVTILGARRARLPDRMMLGSYVKPMEWGRPSVDTPTPSLEDAWSLLTAGTPLTRGTLRQLICVNSTPIFSGYWW